MGVGHRERGEWAGFTGQREYEGVDETRLTNKNPE